MKKMIGVFKRHTDNRQPSGLLRRLQQSNKCTFDSMYKYSKLKEIKVGQGAEGWRPHYFIQDRKIYTLIFNHIYKNNDSPYVQTNLDLTSPIHSPSTGNWY